MTRSLSRRIVNAARELRAGTLLLALIVSLPGAAAAQTFFVDNQSTTCSNAGAGTEAQPYCTITAALAAHQGAGVTIIVKPGVYREQVTVPASGLAGSPFVIRAQGPGVVIDGSDSFANTALWVSAGGSVWRAASVTAAVTQVFVNGARLTPSTAAPALLPVNAFTWVTGQGLYVNLGGANPGTQQTLVARRNFGVNMFTKSWVTIEGFEITRTGDRGINIQNGCTDLTITGNRVSFANSYGIQTVNGQRLVIEANVVSDCNLHGIGLTAGASGCVVRNNESFRNIDPAIRRANGIHLFGAPGNTLSGNRAHDNQDTGIHFAGGSNNCVSYNNQSWKNGDHGYDHLASSGTTHTNDVAFGNALDGFSFEAVSPGSQVHNCISVDNGLTTLRFNLWVDLESSAGFVSNHNIIWNSTTQAPIKFVATIYSALPDYQAVSQQDANSSQADPRFAAAATGDFRLTAGSAAIDAANSAAPGWPATDVEGRARLDDPLIVNRGAGPVTYADVGAFEYVPVAAPPPTVDLAPVVTCPGSVKGTPGSVVSFTISASDPDGQPITSLVMVADKLPANHGAIFTPNATKTGGTFTWATGTATGNFKVKFVAANALTGTGGTNIHIKAKGKAMAEPGVEEPGITELALSSAFPNPSRGPVEFALDLPREASVRWAVYDLQGRTVWSEERSFAAGRVRLGWDGMTTRGAPAATGVYLVRAWVEGTQFTRRIVRF